jgi:cytidine deaminase
MDGVAYTREELIRYSREAAQKAHCPYSKFRVGAAVVADGNIYTGVNIESSSYGLALCAERAALAAAIGAGAVRISQIAVSCIDAAKDTGREQLMPCGACRQWLADLAPDATVIVDGIAEPYKVSELLPFPFRL